MNGNVETPDGPVDVVAVRDSDDEPVVDTVADWVLDADSDIDDVAVGKRHRIEAARL